MNEYLLELTVTSDQSLVAMTRLLARLAVTAENDPGTHVTNLQARLWEDETTQVETTVSVSWGEDDLDGEG